MILVTGATGKLGRLVIAALLETVPPTEVSALVRNPEVASDLRTLGVDVRQGDYNDPASLSAAVQGVDKVLLISSSEIGARASQHKNVIDAAKAARVKLLAYTSILHGGKSPLALAKEHAETEAYILAADVPYVILRNGWYFENYTENLGAALEHGAILGAAQEGRIAAASRRDFAQAAAAVVTRDGTAGQVYELAGDVPFTMNELAAEVSRQFGKEVVYSDMPQDKYSEFLQSVGLPGPVADIFADSDAHAARGALNDASGDLKRLIGRPTTTLSEAVRKAANK